VFWFNVGNVQLTKLPDVGVPNNGAIKVGVLVNTTAPEPVLVVDPVPPLSTGKAVPEYVNASVPDPVTGEPPTVKNAGAVNPTDVTVPPGFEELIVTFGHVPDTVTLVPAVIAAVVEPVPPLSTGSVPVTPVVNGRPVRLVATPDNGVPSAGPVNVGLVNVNPVIVAAVPPSEIVVEPTVTALLANAAFGIAVNPVPIDPEVKVPTLVSDDVTTPLANVVPVILPAATEPAEPEVF
jgi:hypothetical protein